DLGVELFGRHSRFESGDRREKMERSRTTDGVRSEIGEGNPDVDGLWSRVREIRSHDADDGVRAAVERDRLAGDRRVGAEATLPKAMAQHDELVATFDLFVGGEYTAEQGVGAEGLEESGCDENGGKPLGRAAAGEIDAGGGVVEESADRFSELAARPDI